MAIGATDLSSFGSRSLDLDVVHFDWVVNAFCREVSREIFRSGFREVFERFIGCVEFRADFGIVELLNITL
jgi:hypothetical protein